MFCAIRVQILLTPNPALLGGLRPLFRQEKERRRLPSGVGVFHVKGQWSKNLLPPLKVCVHWDSKEGNWDVPAVLPGCTRPLGVFKEFVQKLFVLIFPPLTNLAAAVAAPAAILQFFLLCCFSFSSCCHCRRRRSAQVLHCNRFSEVATCMHFKQKSHVLLAYNLLSCNLTGSCHPVYFGGSCLGLSVKVDSQQDPSLSGCRTPPCSVA